jgi:hypothetical protein
MTESKRPLKDYQSIKDQINKLYDLLHFERLYDHDEEETSLIVIQYVFI